MNPLVSLVCVTYNRAKYLPTAIRCFEQQTYSNLELVIVDDGTEQIELPQDSRIRYIRLDTRASTGAKRNIGAQAAHGEIIAALDDDDWSSPHRIEDQVRRLGSTGKAVTGYNETIRYCEETGKVYRNAAAYPYHVSGTSQCYLKSWWKKNPYPDISCGEDMEFSRVAIMCEQLSTAPLGGTIIARKHSTNTSLVVLRDLKEISRSEVSSEFFKAVEGAAPTLEYMTAGHECTPDCQRAADAQFGAIPYQVGRPRILVAIESCHRDKDNGAQQAQRDTWIRDLIENNIDYRFFLGRPQKECARDEVFLDVDDTYNFLSFKTQAICQWALDHGYELLHKTDTDTLVSVRNLIVSSFELHDYMGSENEDFTPVAYRQRRGAYPGSRIKFASGGAGYWLSRKAMEAVVQNDDAACGGSAEDVFVAVALKAKDIKPVWCGDMKWRPGESWTWDTISLHLSSVLQKKYEPRLMHEYYHGAEVNRWMVETNDDLNKVHPLGKDSLVYMIGGFKGDWVAEIVRRYDSFVHVFEPVPTYYEILKSRFEDNPKISLFNFGLSDHSFTGTIGLNEDASSLYKSAASNVAVEIRDVCESFPDSVDLMSINAEGAEYEILSRLIETKSISKIKNVQVQFHRIHPQAAEMRNVLCEKLKETHEETYCYPFVWENWTLK